MQVIFGHFCFFAESRTHRPRLSYDYKCILACGPVCNKVALPSAKVWVEVGTGAKEAQIPSYQRIKAQVGMSLTLETVYF